MKKHIIAFLALLWRFIVWIWSILILGIAIGVLGNASYTYFTTGHITFADPHTLTIITLLSSHPYRLALILAVILLLTLCTYLADRSQRTVSQTTAEHPVSTLSGHNRQRLLEKVRAFWITGVLEQSLHGAALIALGLHEQSDAVANPWRLVFQQPNQSAHKLPTGTSITQVYDDAAGELLILGEPGSGKTTLLLELTRDLLDRAGRDDSHPIPVVFNLSSWANKRQPFTMWLIEELNSKYQVPHSLGQSWTNTDQVLPLLDGLDEVTPSYRMACVEAINVYRREHGMVPMVVCSRSADYLAQTIRLSLRNAAVVQPLTTQQIDDYLASVGEQLAAVRMALSDDPMLQELAVTPLMLSVLTLAYHGMSAENLLSMGSTTMRRQQIFATYVQRMLQHRSTETRYTPQQTIRWLTWLAWQLAQHSQTEFYIERMQPDWLPDNQSRRLFLVLLVRLVIGLISGIGGGLSGGLIGGLLGWLYRGPSGGLFGGLLGGLFGGLLGKPDGRLIFIVVDKLLKGPGGRLDTEIKPAEVVVWSGGVSWNRLIKSLRIRIGLFGGLFAGLTIGLAIGLHNGLRNGLVIGLLVALASELLSGLYVALDVGLSSDMLDQSNLVRPNQGIWRSARNGMLLGLGVWLFGGWLVGLIVTLVVGPTVGLVGGLVGGLLAGLVGWIWGGGVACVKHMILRLLLWRAGSMPLNYAKFLDYTAERILLRKVGGGYIFVHRLLLEYFASLDTTLTAVDVAEHPPNAPPALQ